MSYEIHTILQDLNNRDLKQGKQNRHKSSHPWANTINSNIKQYLASSTLAESPSRSPGSISKSSGDSKSSRPCINPKALVKNQKVECQLNVLYKQSPDKC